MSEIQDTARTDKTVQGQGAGASTEKSRELGAQRLLLLAVALGLGAYTLIATQHRLGTFASPGPGFIPLVAGGVATLLVVSSLLRTWKKENDHQGADAGSPESFGSWRRIIAFVGTLLGYILIVSRLGQFVAAVFMLIATMIICRSRPIWQIVLISTLVAVGSVLLFGRVLNIPLPTGVLGF